MGPIVLLKARENVSFPGSLEIYAFILQQQLSPLLFYRLRSHVRCKLAVRMSTQIKLNIYK